MSKLNADVLFDAAVAMYAQMAATEQEVLDGMKGWSPLNADDPFLFNASMFAATRIVTDRPPMFPKTQIGLPQLGDTGYIELMLTTVRVTHYPPSPGAPDHQIVMTVKSDDSTTKEMGFCLVDDRSRYVDSFVDLNTHLAVGAIVGWRYMLIAALSQVVATKPPPNPQGVMRPRPVRLNMTALLDAIGESQEKTRAGAIIKLFGTPVTGVHFVTHSLVDERDYKEEDNEEFTGWFRNCRIVSTKRTYSAQRALGCSLETFVRELGNLHSSGSPELEEFIKSNYAVTIPHECIVIPSLSSIIEQIEDDDFLSKPTTEPFSYIEARQHIIECVLPKLPPPQGRYDRGNKLIEAVGVPMSQFDLEWHAEQCSTERLYMDIFSIGAEATQECNPEFATKCTREEYESFATKPNADMQTRSPDRLRRYQDTLTLAAKIHHEVLSEWGRDALFTFEEALVASLLITLYTSTYSVPLPQLPLCDSCIVIARAYEPMPVHDYELENGPPRE